MTPSITAWVAPLLLVGALGVGTWVQPAVQPPSPEELAEVAIGYYKADKNEFAWQTFEETLRRSPTEFRALYGAGTLALAEKKYQLAEKYFLTALQVQPLHKDAALSLGASYQKAESYDKAIQVYERLLKLDPTFAPAHYNLGMLYLAIGDASAGIRYLETYLRLEPHSPDLERVESRLAKARKVLQESKP